MAVIKTLSDDSLLPNNLKIWRRYYGLEESDNYFRYFAHLKGLRQGQVHLFGKNYPTPRLEAFYGKSGLSYSYAHQRFIALPFCKVLLDIKAAVEFTTNYNYNAVLVNYYRDGNDSNGWHADNEPELGNDPVVASLSFGVSRRFYLKSNETNETLKLMLEHGDLLFMGKGIQTEWKHCVPKSPKVLEGRINLTFRNIIQR